jgi:hypothetical protein
MVGLVAVFQVFSRSHEELIDNSWRVKSENAQIDQALAVIQQEGFTAVLGNEKKWEEPIDVHGWLYFINPETSEFIVFDFRADAPDVPVKMRRGPIDLNHGSPQTTLLSDFLMKKKSELDMPGPAI